jgi:hypothetical protein
MLPYKLLNHKNGFLRVKNKGPAILRISNMHNASMSSHAPDTQRGSVIIWILIGVALFAGLSYAVSGMLRNDGGSTKIAEEKAGLIASEILDYARSMRQTAQVLKISGCAETDISFENDTVAGYEFGTPGPDKCRVFRTPGGALNYVVPSSEWLDSANAAQARYGEWYFLGETCVYDVGTGSTDCATTGATSDNELVAVLPWIKESLCVAINDRLGITNPSGRPPQIAASAWAAGMPKFTGSYVSSANAIQSVTSGVAILKGQLAGCLRGHTSPPDNTYHFYQVLLAR